MFTIYQITLLNTSLLKISQLNPAATTNDILTTATTKKHTTNNNKNILMLVFV